MRKEATKVEYQKQLNITNLKFRLYQKSVNKEKKNKKWSVIHLTIPPQ